jgi:type III restriction enzyme
MENRFFEKPILNSPYKYPAQHWELDASGQPTQRIIENRRRAEFITPIAKKLGSYGRWAFAEFTEAYQIEADFEARIETEFNKVIEGRMKG